MTARAPIQLLLRAWHTEDAGNIHLLLEFLWFAVQSMFRLMRKDVIWGFRRLFPTVRCKGLI